MDRRDIYIHHGYISMQNQTTQTKEIYLQRTGGYNSDYVFIRDVSPIQSSVANPNAWTSGSATGTVGHIKGEIKDAELTASAGDASVTLTMRTSNFPTTYEKRFYYEIWEYIGPEDGPNEFKVRHRDEIIYPASTASQGTSINVGASLPGLTYTDWNDCVLFKAGQNMTSSSSVSSRQSFNSIAMCWTFFGLPFISCLRGNYNFNGAIRNPYTIVEFTGSNWSVQFNLQGITASTHNMTLGTAVDWDHSFQIVTRRNSQVQDLINEGNYAQEVGAVCLPQTSTTYKVEVDPNSDQVATNTTGGANQFFVTTISNPDMHVYRKSSVTDATHNPSPETNFAEGTFSTAQTFDFTMLSSGTRSEITANDCASFGSFRVVGELQGISAAEWSLRTQNNSGAVESRWYRNRSAGDGVIAMGETTFTSEMVVMPYTPRLRNDMTIDVRGKKAFEEQFTDDTASLAAGWTVSSVVGGESITFQSGSDTETGNVLEARWASTISNPITFPSGQWWHRLDETALTALNLHGSDWPVFVRRIRAVGYDFATQVQTAQAGAPIWLFTGVVSESVGAPTYRVTDSEGWVTEYWDLRTNSIWNSNDIYRVTSYIMNSTSVSLYASGVLDNARVEIDSYALYDEAEGVKILNAAAAASTDIVMAAPTGNGIFIGASEPTVDIDLNDPAAVRMQGGSVDPTVELDLNAPAANATFVGAADASVEIDLNDPVAVRIQGSSVDPSVELDLNDPTANAILAGVADPTVEIDLNDPEAVRVRGGAADPNVDIDLNDPTANAILAGVADPTVEIDLNDPSGTRVQGGEADPNIEINLNDPTANAILAGAADATVEIDLNDPTANAILAGVADPTVELDTTVDATAILGGAADLDVEINLTSSGNAILTSTASPNAIIDLNSPTGTAILSGLADLTVEHDLETNAVRIAGGAASSTMEIDLDTVAQRVQGASAAPQVAIDIASAIGTAILSGSASPTVEIDVTPPVATAIKSGVAQGTITINVASTGTVEGPTDEFIFVDSLIGKTVLVDQATASAIYAMAIQATIASVDTLTATSVTVTELQATLSTDSAVTAKGGRFTKNT